MSAARTRRERQDLQLFMLDEFRSLLEVLDIELSVEQRHRLVDYRDALTGRTPQRVMVIDDGLGKGKACGLSGQVQSLGVHGHSATGTGARNHGC